uniref:Fucolectin tachylectin-4 pentraxin-1 domain-containing protein n=1 Tax=Salmo trutta TaxID=8032 RepID=A0A673VZK5_SALTR
TALYNNHVSLSLPHPLSLSQMCCHLPHPINVALKGVASQSSLNGYGNAHNAIDGNRESDYYKRSCTHTAQNTNPWWRVDLLDVYRVTAVSITNRGDDVPERLDGAEIRIGNSLENNGINNPRCVVISHIPAGKTYTFQCNEMEGRYVVVVIPGRSEWLTLCEVEVFDLLPELTELKCNHPNSGSYYRIAKLLL